MATNQLAIAIFSILLLTLAFQLASANEDYKKKIEKKVEIVIEGMVYCQSCDKHGSWSPTGAEPIASAKVSVICKSYRNQVSFYKVYQTNANGYFYAPLDGFRMTNNILEHPLQACHVKPVSSPLAHCSLLSNVNNGLDGAGLKYKKVLGGSHYEAVVYAAGPSLYGQTNALLKLSPEANHRLKSSIRRLRFC